MDCTLVKTYNWDTKIAYAICMAESHGNPQAYNGNNSNGTNDAGLMQINSIHTDLISLQDRFDPIKNMATAYKIYQHAGWTAWSTYNNLSYQRYIVK
jgi:hypothetical protein